jgi:hypothetical protein
VSHGDVVEFDYLLENQGDGPLTDVTAVYTVDPEGLPSRQAIQQLSDIPAGGSTRVPWSVELGHPRIDYSVESRDGVVDADVPVDVRSGDDQVTVRGMVDGGDDNDTHRA